MFGAYCCAVTCHLPLFGYIRPLRSKGQFEFQGREHSSTKNWARPFSMFAPHTQLRIIYLGRTGCLHRARRVKARSNPLSPDVLDDALAEGPRLPLAGHFY